MFNIGVYIQTNNVSKYGQHVECNLLCLSLSECEISLIAINAEVYNKKCIPTINR